ncbi:MAG: threonine/serine dehydratase [Actinomycetia bacterium]|nr:threonine/serine dehydratase [Actinomycetes bacterium]
MRVPTYDDIVDAAQRIDPYVHRTPVFTSRYFNQVVQAEVFFKAENLQKVGAFKARGATNAVLSLSDTDAGRGILTHSSGNHGQAVAYAAGIRAIPAVVVMPDHAPRVKIDAVARYGAEIVFCKQAERENMVETIRAESGAVVIHPFDNPDVIAGQGTVTLEFVDQVEGLDTIVAPIGGGGLLSGASLVGDQRGIEVVGAEPEVVDDAYRSLRDGVRYGETGQLSVGDGLLTGIGELAFEILRSHSRRILTVSEAEILEMVGVVAMRMKLVIEPSAATAVAAVTRYRSEFTDRRVGIIISGGNISLDTLGGLGS